MSRMQDKYNKEVAPALMEKFSYKSTMQIPKLDKIVINFREYKLFLDTNRIVTSAIEAIRIDTSEISYTRKCDIEKSVYELIHLVASQCYLTANVHSFSQLEVSN